MTSVRILADSLNGLGDRLVTFLVTFPRLFEPELLRHRMLSFSAASSRAINLRKHINNVSDNTFIPTAFTTDNKGMSSTGVLKGISEAHARATWRKAHQHIEQASLSLMTLGVHKQHASRLLQPFEMQTYMVTGTEWKHFFELRCPQYLTASGATYHSLATMYAIEGDQVAYKNVGHAQPEFMELAELMYDAMLEHTPKVLKAGEWHLPYGDNIDAFELTKAKSELQDSELLLKICSARAARISYLNHDGVINFADDKRLVDRLISVKHASVFEHCAKVMSPLEYENFVRGNIGQGIKFKNKGWCNNFKGFIQYRYFIENPVTEK